jgi:hypothetical protein
MPKLLFSGCVNAKVWATDYPFKSPASSANSLIFGHEAGSDGNNDYDGDMWLPQIWSTNLSPVDVANLYFNQRNGSAWPP